MKRSLAAMIAAALVSQGTAADAVTFRFTGTVTSTNVLSGPFTGAAPGNAAEVQFTFDPLAAPIVNLATLRLYDGAVSALSLSIGATSVAATAADAGTFRLGVQNASSDNFGVSNSAVPPSAGFRIELTVIDNQGTVFPSTSLPTSLDLSQFETRIWRVYEATGPNTRSVTISTAAFEVVGAEPQDGDGDGLSDDDENDIYLTDPDDPDSDDDGLDDGTEVNSTLTDPNAADSDGDGLGDGTEVNSTLTDPNASDSDSDGLDDGLEVNVSLTNPNLADSDGDALSDGAELNTTFTDPLVADTDGDGLNDGTEIEVADGGTCPDPLVFDSDGDGILDGDEAGLGADPCKVDSDDDGIPDGIDPLPADPGGTFAYIEQSLRDLAAYVANPLALPAPLFGGNGNRAKGLRNAMGNKVTAAANAVADGDVPGAIDQLQSLYAKVDGDLEPPPPDWISDSSQKDFIAGEILELLMLLEYLL